MKIPDRGDSKFKGPEAEQAWCVSPFALIQQMHSCPPPTMGRIHSLPPDVGSGQMPLLWPKESEQM